MIFFKYLVFIASLCGLSVRVNSLNSKAKAYKSNRRGLSNGKGCLDVKKGL